MARIIVATRNKGKLREIEALISDEFEVVGLDDLDKNIRIVEDADTFEGNALKKVSAVAAIVDAFCLSDDSGLEVDALSGAPGVHSARYGGPNLTDENRCRQLLQEPALIKSVDRTARFQAVLAFHSPGEQPKFFRGTLEGRISKTLEGADGFGYDPIFIPAGFNRTLAALGPILKNRISHRAQALLAFAAFLKERRK